MPQLTKTAIMAIGGAEDKVHGREILQAFVSRSGGTDASLAIIPSASREPALISDRYQQIFSDLGVERIKILDVRDRQQVEDPYFQTYIEQCTGVFMTGGDQLRLCGLWADTPLMNRIRQRGQQGEITVAGTSAGAAVMGYHMIAGGGSGESPNRALVDMTVGLSLVPEAIVDQHFHNRNRMARLLSAIAVHPDRLGLGIDEDTCVIFERDGQLQIMGRGTVTVIDAKELTHTNCSQVGVSDPLSLHGMQLHILGHGDRFHLHKRCPIT